MPVGLCDVNLDAMRRELAPHGTDEFPCAAYSRSFPAGGDLVVPWHWHEQIELVCVASGAMEYSVPGLSQRLEAGDCFAVNSNVLHAARALERCELRSLVFSLRLVSGGEGTIFSRRYLDTLSGGRGFTGAYLPAAEFPGISAAFSGAFEAMAREPRGYEFTVRGALSDICLELSEHFANDGGRGRSPDAVRVQRMLSRIHSGYASPLSLAEIAASANVSERECERAFKRLIGLTPKQYLIKYRAAHAAELLVSRPGLSVSEIAGECGFGSAAAFARSFRAVYGLSPRSYRSKRGRELDGDP